MTPQELAADLRSRINPLYADQLGTESYERRICAEAIEALVQERDAMRAEKILHDQAWCDEAERTIKQLQIALKIKAEEHTCCSEDLIKLKHGANKLAAENKTLRDALALAKDLTTIVRMPNVEYIADAHNKAVEKIQALTRSKS